ncbi:MAG: hypothetical protein FJX76_23120 [Armatimonadetes bacterium]|nr:hypothetical protein [Armatimonadota bacterium]
MSRFDAHLVGELADSLDTEADKTPFLYAVAGAILGAAALSMMLTDLLAEGPHRVIAIVIGAALGLLLGFALGRQRAFAMRMQAQLVLAQVQLERNTKKEKAPVAEAVPTTAASARREPPTMQKSVLSRPVQKAAP